MFDYLKQRSTPAGRALPLAAKVSIVLLIIMGVAALPSGWGLMHPAPDGTALGMPSKWLQGSPFSSFLIPGLILFALFGLGALATAALALLRSWPAPYFTFAMGIGLMIWIVVQLLALGRYFFLQPIMFVWGLALVLLAYVWWRAVWRRA
jgi:hypothetical protein